MGSTKGDPGVMPSAQEAPKAVREAPAPRPRGRPRKVTREAALEAAMQVFWAEGFEGASIDRLSRAMGVPRATLYQEHGDKEGLFLGALGHFTRTRLQVPMAALAGPGPLRADLLRFYEAVIDMALSADRAPGCLMASALSDAAGANLRLRAELDRHYTGLEKVLTRRFAAARAELAAPDTPPETLALLAASVARGMMLRARAGSDRATMQAACRAAVAALFTAPAQDGSGATAR